MTRFIIIQIWPCYIFNISGCAGELEFNNTVQQYVTLANQIWSDFYILNTAFNMGE